MSDEGVHGQGSSAPALVVDDKPELPSQNTGSGNKRVIHASDSKEHVEPATVVLEAMLKERCLPYPEYNTKDIGYDNYEAEVRFYPSMYFIKTSPTALSLLGDPEKTLERAVNNAARQAIWYMERQCF